MLRYPQKTDPEIMGENREAARSLAEELQPEIEPARAAGNAALFNVLGGEERSLGVYAYAAGEPPADALAHLRAAAGHFATAWELGIVTDVFDYLDGLALAIVTGGDALAQQLAEAPRARYENEDVEAEEVSFLVAELTAALALDRPETATGRVALAQKELAKKKLGRYDRIRAEGLVALGAAIVAGDQRAFDAAAHARLADFQKMASPADDCNSPGALLDIPGLAYVRLARGRGLRFSGESVYWPVNLLPPA